MFSSHVNVELEREYFQVVIFHLLSRSFRMLGMLEGFRLVWRRTDLVHLTVVRWERRLGSPGTSGLLCSISIRLAG